MLEKIDFDVAPISKEEYKPVHDELVNKLVVLQQQAHSKGVGLVVLFEGWNGAGRGGRISDLLYELDARATSVHVADKYDAKQAKAFHKMGQGVTGFFPQMQQFWKALDMRGNMTIFDRGWYDIAASQIFNASSKEDPKEILARSVASFEAFEKQLFDDGYIVVKFFLHISKRTQAQRLRALGENEATSWRLEKGALKQVKAYDEYYRIFDELLSCTNFDHSQWMLVNSEDRRRCNMTIANTLVNALDQAINGGVDPEAKAAAQKAQANSAGLVADVGEDERTRSAEEQSAVREGNELLARKQAELAPLGSRFPIEPGYPTLKGADYHLSLDQETYRRELKIEQKRLYELELEMYLKRVPLMIMFEGQDAAGKGGAIKRVAQALDARSYVIFPSPAPTRPELMHPFLWRYWTRLPKAGHVGIYDRSWYGRVLVERVEGFASPKEWARAYDEINEFERDLVDWGAILLKFWVEIDRDEQLARFNARASDPRKQWKITDEDWRNRDKYPQYREAVEDMFRLTSTEYAPWVILESNDKLYARIKTLKFINRALERRLHGEKRG